MKARKIGISIGLSEQQQQLIHYIHNWTEKIFSNGGTHDELLLSLCDLFEEARQIQHCCSTQEMERWYVDYPGFALFMELLEKSDFRILSEKNNVH